MTKHELRQHIRTLKKQYLTGGQPLCEAERLLTHPRIAASHTVLAYSALPDEAPTQTLIDLLVGQGKTVLLPRVVSSTDLELYRYTGADSLRKGAYGILEPTGEPFTDYAAIEVAIIPGVAFDAAGHRLGHGKGYYDRLLARIPYIYKIGFCFSWQMVDHVPTDSNDIVMDEVIRI